ncbi:hypothetical protein T10_4782 [Trichinella papuae]|uniref:Uncharacterized protein n=1 Tax=Trichinella papuae TaxID=268474 RepID=A0A0V1MY80_9BILA|nr:hypothetical protein T10_4782 [Trichinella papuae]
MLRTETDRTDTRSIDATLFVKSIVGHLETVFTDKMLVRGITQAEGSREITNHSRGLIPDQQQADYPLRTENCNHAIKKLDGKIPIQCEQKRSIFSRLQLLVECDSMKLMKAHTSPTMEKIVIRTYGNKTAFQVHQ